MYCSAQKGNDCEACMHNTRKKLGRRLIEWFAISGLICVMGCEMPVALPHISAEPESGLTGNIIKGEDGKSTLYEWKFNAINPYPTAYRYEYVITFKPIWADWRTHRGELYLGPNEIRPVSGTDIDLKQWTGSVRVWNISYTLHPVVASRGDESIEPVFIGASVSAANAKTATCGAVVTEVRADENK